MKHITLTFAFLSFLATALAQSYTNYALPITTVLVTSFSSDDNTVETCTGFNSGCGTAHPQSDHIILVYDWYGNGGMFINDTYLKGRWEAFHSGPAYHTDCLTLDTFGVTNGIVSAAYETRICNYGGGNTSSVSNAITSLNTGEGPTMGTLSCSITNDSLITTRTLEHMSRLALRISGGNHHYIYNYRVFFYADYLDGCPGSDLFDYGPVECSIPGRVCYDYSYGLFYFDVAKEGGYSSMWLDVTVQAEAPFYRYSVNPTLLNVIENPD